MNSYYFEAMNRKKLNVKSKIHFASRPRRTMRFFIWIHQQMPQNVANKCTKFLSLLMIRQQNHFGTKLRQLSKRKLFQVIINFHRTIFHIRRKFLQAFSFWIALLGIGVVVSSFTGKVFNNLKLFIPFIFLLSETNFCLFRI
jgi:hypothetical protein